MIPDWARAHGEPVCTAAIRATPEDFVVEELLGFDPDGDGEHDFLTIRKTGANTSWVARQLAKHAGIPVRDVGYSGLKDRNAVTTQYFTVRRPGGGGTDWNSFAAEGVELLDSGRHGRKLRRGSHKGNRFRIGLRGNDLDTDEIRGRLEIIETQGVPNYFGEQRFGRDGNNIELAREVLAGKRVKREQRSIAISAARSFLFNQILDARVCDGTWNVIQAGDLANLDGSNSVFGVDDVSKELLTRCSDMDIHPAGSLWGDGAPRCSGLAAAAECRAIESSSELSAGLEAARVDAASRALRAVVRDMNAGFDDTHVVLEFSLSSGSFATAVLREII